MPTSVPTWPSSPPAADTTGLVHAVLTVGDPARATGQEWVDQLQRAERRVLWHHADDDAPHAPSAAGDGGPAVRWAERQARAARVGWRFCVAGPEQVVLLACAAVRARGALDSEITAHATGVRTRRVLCTHCRTTTATGAAVGGTVPCTGCSRTLLVHHHVSRRHASYMGFMADAEEPRAGEVVR